MRGYMHPSLQAYIDCFSSPPFPRAFPRGGGVWDQDPILMRDFRMIREFEIQWKQTQEQLHSIQSDAVPNEGGGQEFDLESKLEEMLEEKGLTNDQYF